MSKKYTQESFSESLDRRLSGFQTDPWLAQRIIASGKGETKVKKKVSGFAIVIAIILVLTMATAIAAKLAGWRLDSMLGMTEGQKENYQETGLLDEPRLSVTKNEVTVVLDQCVAVPQAAYIAFRVKGYPVQPGQEPGFGTIECGDAHGETFIDWNASFHSEETESGKYSYADENGDLLFYFIGSPSGSDTSMTGMDLRVVLDDLGVSSGKADDVVQGVKGPWEFVWTLKGTDRRVDLTDLNAPIGGDGCILTEAHMTPLSIDMRMIIPRELNANSVMEDAVPYFSGVRYADGTVLTELNNGCSEGYENRESNIYGETVTLDRVIDPEQVESLLFYWSAAWGNDDLPGWDEEEHEPVLYEIRIR